MEEKEEPIKYDAPLIEVVEVVVERGFSATNGQDMIPTEGRW